jgi:hypothetical protein
MRTSEKGEASIHHGRIICAFIASCSQRETDGGIRKCSNIERSRDAHSRPH